MKSHAPSELFHIKTKVVDEAEEEDKGNQVHLHMLYRACLNARVNTALSPALAESLATTFWCGSKAGTGPNTVLGSPEGLPQRSNSVGAQPAAT